MKQIWPTYAYSPTTNVLTLTGLNIDRDQLLLVTAADRGRIMYNFADSSVTASAFTSGANTALTLVATTAGLTTTAALVIYFDDQATSSTVTGTVELGPTSLNALESITVTMGQVTVTGGLTDVQLRASAVTVGGTVTVGNSLTISSLPALSAGTAQIGSVTASLLTSADFSQNFADVFIERTSQFAEIQTTIISPLPAGTNRIGVVTIGAGTVTIGAGTAQIGSVTASISGTVPISISSVTVGNSVTIGSLPAISGTVTANLSISSTVITSGSFTSLTSATLVPSNTARKMATVYNLGAGQLFVQAGATATTLGGGFMVALSSGDFYECDYTTTTLSAIFATAGTASWVSH
jgi:hypothetical protein